MLSKLFLIGIYLLFIFSCNCNSTSKNKIEIIKMTSKEKIKLKQEFNKIEIIPLNTTDNSLIGLGVEGFKCFQNKLYLQNRLPSHANLLCFDNNGNFLFKIDSPGRGPKEYSYFGNFFIDTLKKEIGIISANNRYLFYDISGIFLYSKRSTDDFMPREIVIQNENYIAFHDPAESPKGYDLFILDPQTMKYKRKIKISGEEYLLYRRSCIVQHRRKNPVLPF